MRNGQVRTHTSNLAVSLRINTEWGGRHEFVVTGGRWNATDQVTENVEIVHTRSEAIKLRNALSKMIKATAPPPKKRKVS